MHRMLTFAAAIDRFNAAIGRLMIWAVLASVLLAAASALLRKLLHLYSNSWTELQWYLFGAVILFSAAHLLHIDEHVRVDVLARRWSARTRSIVDLVALVAVALPISLIMMHLGAAHAWSAWHHGEHSYMADGLVICPVRALVPIGFALFALQAVAEIIRRVDALCRLRP
jgi:TRAP-type mannitol/chloroaromatic compound transport system permease small subunit